MKTGKLLNKLIVRAVTICVVGCISAPVSAQEFFAVSDRLQLYCVYTPGETLLATYTKKSKEVLYSDFDTQITRVEKIRKQTVRRINTLKRMKRDGTIDYRERKSFKKIYKNFIQRKYKGDNEVRVANFNKLIRMGETLLEELTEILAEIEKCRNRDLDLALASGMSIQTLVVEFTHPVHKASAWLAGVAFVTDLNKKAVRKGGGNLCVANSSSIKEGIWPFETNLCSTLIDYGAGGLVPWHYGLRCPPGLAGLPANSGIRWAKWGLYAAPLSDAKIAEWDRYRDGLIEKGYRARPWVKKRGGCIK